MQPQVLKQPNAKDVRTGQIWRGRKTHVVWDDPKHIVTYYDKARKKFVRYEITDFETATELAQQLDQQFG